MIGSISVDNIKKTANPFIMTTAYSSTYDLFEAYLVFFTAFVSPSPNLHVRKSANANLEGFPTTFLKVKNTESNPVYSLCRTVKK